MNQQITEWMDELVRPVQKLSDYDQRHEKTHMK